MDNVIKEEDYLSMLRTILLQHYRTITPRDDKNLMTESDFLELKKRIQDKLRTDHFMTKNQLIDWGTTISIDTLRDLYHQRFLKKEYLEIRQIKSLNKLCLYFCNSDWREFKMIKEQEIAKLLPPSPESLFSIIKNGVEAADKAYKLLPAITDIWKEYYLEGSRQYKIIEDRLKKGKVVFDWPEKIRIEMENSPVVIARRDGGEDFSDDEIPRVDKLTVIEQTPNKAFVSGYYYWVSPKHADIGPDLNLFRKKLFELTLSGLVWKIENIHYAWATKNTHQDALSK